MRTLTTLFRHTAARSLVIGCTALAACVGHIGGDDTGEPTTIGPTPTSFGCDPAAAALTATPIKRLAKIYLEHALEEFLSPLSEGSRTALLASIGTRFDLIPLDDSEYFADNDDKISQDHVDAVFGLALGLAAKIMENPGYASELLSVCGDGLDTSALAQDACLTSFVSYYGRKTFRRPLSPAEIDDFKAFYQQAVTEGVDGLAMLVGRFIAHPSFYYRFDSAGALVSGTEGQDAVYRLDRWELLSKITFLFWASPPTDALYDLAESTDLTEDAALSALLDQILADPRAERGIFSFYREWLELDTTKMPGTADNLAATQALVTAAGLASLPTTHRDDMIQEVLDMAKHYSLSSEGKLDDILTSQHSFARTPELAAIYGVAPWDGSATALVSLPAGERSGLLTRAALLASNAEYTRPIIKGKNIRTQLLCMPIPPPPADLDIKPLVHPPDKTTRQAVEEATADPKCQQCHGTFNNLGFISESYDPLGRVRDKELRFADGTGDIVSELDIDTTAVAELYEGESKEITNAVELGEYLAGSGVVHACMVRNYFQFVTGRAEDDKTDGCDMENLRNELTASDGSIKAMLRASVMQLSFRQRKVN